MKPTREEIEHRAVEILLNSKVHYCRLCNKKNSIACNATCVSSVMESTLEIAEEELSKPQLKPQLTEDEKVILRNIDKKYKWIARDFDGQLFVYGQKPYVLGKIWTEYTKMYNALPVSCFKFITWEDDEQPYSIAELLGEDDA